MNKKIIYLGIIILLSSCVRIVEKDETVVKQEYLDSLKLFVSQFENDRKLETSKKYAVAVIKCKFCTNLVNNECINWDFKTFRSEIEEVSSNYSEEVKYQILEKLAMNLNFCEDADRECQIERNFLVFDKYSQASEFRNDLIND